MCFNYLCEAYQVTECESKGTCGNWQASHVHMLQVSRTGTIGCWELSKTTSGDNKEARRDLSVVVILVDGIKCRAPLDTGAERSYIPSELAIRLEKKPLRTDHKQRDNALCNSHTFKDLVRSASNQC